MSRVIQLRVWELDESLREGMQSRFAELAAGRDWRDGPPWLADRASTGLLAQLFFEQAAEEPRRTVDARLLSAAAYVRVAGDEADALAIAFIARDVSERFGVEVEVRDPDNPIAKLRHVELVGGRLRNGAPFESILVRRAIYRRMPDGSRMEMIPPRSRSSVFGRPLDDPPERGWSFIVHDIRVVEHTFLDAEAEAMRIFRGFRSLPPDDRR